MERILILWMTTSALASSLFAQTQRELELLQRIERLEQRLAALEARQAPLQPPEPHAQPAQMSPPALLPAGATVNVNFDGYYSYNFNRPVGRVNLLRAYDVTSSSFSLNQAGVILERPPNVAAGRRLGLRLDLQFGQATETLQGGAQNEVRPQVFRNVFQAYGTYVVPLGRGLAVNFGKFASALGYENNYTKDQINYSRSFWFHFLPFYHMGFHTTYSFSNRLSVTTWLVNGAQQVEDFNGFKSTALLANIRPTSKVSWNLNYYVGREQRDNMRPVPRGRFHVFDTYASWNVTGALTLVGELDTVISRLERDSAPGRTTGGAAYARYQFTPDFGLGARFAYMKDKGRLFGGGDQILRDTTLTATYQPAQGFQARLEYRRDASNRPFFLTAIPGFLKGEQNSATLGLIWWFGAKEGSW